MALFVLAETGRVPEDARPRVEVAQLCTRGIDVEVHGQSVCFLADPIEIRPVFLAAAADEVELPARGAARQAGAGRPGRARAASSSGRLPGRRSGRPPRIEGSFAAAAGMWLDGRVEERALAVPQAAHPTAGELGDRDDLRRRSRGSRATAAARSGRGSARARARGRSSRLAPSAGARRARGCRRPCRVLRDEGRARDRDAARAPSRHDRRRRTRSRPRLPPVDRQARDDLAAGLDRRPRPPRSRPAAGRTRAEREPLRPVGAQTRSCASPDVQRNVPRPRGSRAGGTRDPTSNRYRSPAATAAGCRRPRASRRGGRRPSRPGRGRRRGPAARRSPRST